MRRSGPGGRSGRPRPAGRAERLLSRSSAAPDGHNKKNKKKKSRAERRAARATRSSRGFLLIAGAIAAAAVGLAVRAFAGARRGKRMLADAAAKPLHFTEHARCRMACRWVGCGRVIRLWSGCVCGARRWPCVGAAWGPSAQEKNGNATDLAIADTSARSPSPSIHSARLTALFFTTTHTTRRHITPAQVRATLASGRVNLLKSELDASPCAKLVVDGAVPGSYEGVAETKHAQVVLSACPRDTNVVTVIDTDRDWECHCPGDD
jgi:hypothetical protein